MELWQLKFVSDLDADTFCIKESRTTCIVHIKSWMSEFIEGFKLKLLESIANGERNGLVSDGTHPHTSGSVNIEPIAISYEMTQFNFHEWSKLSLHELAVEINKERNTNFAIACVESISHSLCFILRHEVEANARTYEKVRANLIAVSGADFKAAKFIVANTDCIAEVSKATIATVVVLCLNREACS